MSEFHMKILAGISPFGVAFFIIYVIDFFFDSHNIKIFKRKYYWIFKRTFHSQNTWMIFEFLQLPLVLGISTKVLSTKYQ